MKKSTKAKFRSEAAAQSRRRVAARVRTRCYFDEKGTDPTYQDEGTLIRFLTKRGKIRPKTRSGLCSKHQRMIAREIKRARSLGLLPYRIVG